MNKKSLLAIFVSLSAIAHGLAFPQASQAFTAEELIQTVEQITQVSDAYQRYLQDLDKIKRGSYRVSPQPTRRQAEPEAPAPVFSGGDDLTPQIEYIQMN
jgi:hypothetical protein